MKVKVISLAVVLVCLINVEAATEIPSELRQLLGEITPNFEENLKRGFRNEAVRLQRGKNIKRYTNELDDVLVSIDNTKIELKGLKFPWIPDFRIVTMTANLAMAAIDLDLNLGNLRVEGTYEANNTLLRKWLPVSHVGKISFGFNNVRARGKVGLVIEEDSFVPQNYDIEYTPSDVTIRVGYYAEGGAEIENEISNQEIETTLGKTIWRNLIGIISNLLHDQLGEVVVEFSLTETLVDRDEEYGLYFREQETRANKLLDSLLCSAKDYLVGGGLRCVSTPPFEVVYKGKVSGMQQGVFRTQPGFLQDLATLTREESFSLYEDGDKLTIYGCITLKEFKHGYQDYATKYEDNDIQGSIKVAIYRNRIFVKVTVRKEGERCRSELEKVALTGFWDIDVDTSGLASLSWLRDNVKSWTIGNLRQQAVPVLEKYVTDAFHNAIARSDCVLLLD